MKRRIIAEDIYALELLGDVQLAPDAKTVSYTHTRLDEPSQEYVTHVHVIGIDGKGDKEIHGGTSFTWNHKGDKAAFVSTDSGSAQIWVYDVATEKCRQITTMRYGASSPIWSIDDKTIYYISNAEEREDYKRLTKEISAKERKELEADKANHAWHITDIVHKWDGQGYLPKHKSHIWKVDVATKKQTQLTVGQHNFRMMSLSNDGNALTFVSDAVEDYDYRPKDYNLWMYDLKNNQQILLIDDKIQVENPIFMPGDKQIMFRGDQAELGWGTIMRLYIFDLETKTFRCITRNNDMIDVSDTGISDMKGLGGARNPVINPNTNEVYFLASNVGNTWLYKADFAGNITPVIEGKRQIISFGFDANFTKVAFHYSQVSSPNTLAIYDMKTGKEKDILDPNAELLKTIELSIPEEICFKSFDGINVHGWIMKPIGYEEGKKYPTILEIHGGPQMMYSNVFMHEFQYLAANGYAVCYFNPRGSSGHGQYFESLIQRRHGGIGGGDFQDLMSGVDYVIANYDFVDANRLGVTGGSFGGFMTNWVVGHTNRFKAAVTQRSISNWVSYYGTADYGFCDPELGHASDFYEDRDELVRISPITYVKNIKTPLMILHSECDYRCPLEQAQQLFVELRMLRRDVEMKIFPAQSHGLSRNGRPCLRIERLNTILGWFNKYVF